MRESTIDRLNHAIQLLQEASNDLTMMGGSYGLNVKAEDIIERISDFRVDVMIADLPKEEK
jgi:heptaprenylglyceryl phosphate synthase